MALAAGSAAGAGGTAAVDGAVEVLGAGSVLALSGCPHAAVTKVSDDTTSRADKRSLSERARDAMERVFMTTLRVQDNWRRACAR